MTKTTFISYFQNITVIIFWLVILRFKLNFKYCTELGHFTFHDSAMHSLSNIKLCFGQY